MRLTFIITGLGVGGAENMLYKLLQHINREIFEPYVISLTTKGEMAFKIEELGIPVIALEIKPSLFSLNKFFHLVKLLKKIDPDIVHTWMYHADLIGGLAAKLTGSIQIAWCIRNSDLSVGKSKFSTFITMKLCALLSGWLPNLIVSCSERAKDIHIAAGYNETKFLVIPNGFDLTRFRPDPSARDSVRHELGIPINSTVVGMIARDDPQKNHKGFVCAAGMVNKILPDCYFILVGKGIDQNNNELNKVIAQFGLDKNIYMLGRRDDVPRLIASFDVMALPSSFGEAFPNVLGEAMSCGVPCVVTNVGDSAKIIGDDRFVAPPTDMTNFAKCLIDLITIPSNERALLSNALQQRVRDMYEINIVVRKYEEFYLGLLKST